MNPNTEDNTKDLLKMSLLTVPDENFSMRVMDRIHLEARPKKTILSSISVSWIFTIISLILIPFALPLFVKDFQALRILNDIYFMFNAASITIIMSTCFAIIILLILNSLIRLTLEKREYVST